MNINLKALIPILVNTSKKLEEQFADAPKIYSASELHISDKQVGGKVELVGGDGKLQPAPDGDYQLEDGTKFTVSGGLIVSIEGETTPPTDVKAADTTQTEIDTLKSEIEAIKTSIEDIKKMIADDAAKDDAEQETTNQFKAQLQELTNTIKSLAKIPAEFSKTSENNYVKDEKEAQKIELASIFKKLK